MSTPQYTDLPERAQRAVEDFLPPDALVEERTLHFASVTPRNEDREGDTEELDSVIFTHHFVDAPGDHETVRFHYAEAAAVDGEAIVF
jgi:hypothetical protein